MTEVLALNEHYQWIRQNLPLDNLGHITSCSAAETCRCATLGPRLAARDAIVATETVERALRLIDETLAGWKGDPFERRTARTIAFEDCYRDLAEVADALRPHEESQSPTASEPCTECSGNGLEVALNGRVTGDCRVCKGTGR